MPHFQWQGGDTREAKTEVGMMSSGRIEINGEKRKLVRSMLTGEIQASASDIRFEDCMVTGRIFLRNGSRLVSQGGMLTGEVHVDQTSSIDVPWGMHTGRVMRI